MKIAKKKKNCTDSSKGSKNDFRRSSDEKKHISIRQLLVSSQGSRFNWRCAGVGVV